MEFIEEHTSITGEKSYQPSAPYNYTQGSGYRTYNSMISGVKCESLFTNVTLEILCFLFDGHAETLISTYGFDATRLICDVNKRRARGITDDVLRRNGNPRESKVLKKSGKTALYVSPYIRNQIQRNVDLFNIAAEFYGTKKLAFTTGLDHIIYKSSMSEESLPILDCRIFEPLQDLKSQNNPFHYVMIVCIATANGLDSNDNQENRRGKKSIRITSPPNDTTHYVPNFITNFVTNQPNNQNQTNNPNQPNNQNRTNYLNQTNCSNQIDEYGNCTSEKDCSKSDKPEVVELDPTANASISLLENFDLHFKTIISIIGPYGKYPIGKQKKHIDVSLLENLNIKGINEELLAIHESHQRNIQKRAVNGQYTSDNPGADYQEFKPLKWVNIDMKPGDVLVFDCRIPYITSRNKYNTPSMYVPYSIRPVGDDWYLSVQFKQLTDAVTTGKAGNWGKRSFKGCNIEEFKWRKTQKILPSSTIDVCTDTSKYSDQDRLIFGLDRY